MSSLLLCERNVAGRIIRAQFQRPLRKCQTALAAPSRTSRSPLHCLHHERTIPRTALALHDFSPLSRRFDSSASAPISAPALLSRHDTKPSQQSADTTSPQDLESQQEETRSQREKPPAYDMTFTCKVCSDRSTHRISKQGYHNGTVLVSCPGCKNRHLISDHLKIFSDSRITLEDIMREKGQLIKKGSLDADGNVEFWDDETKTERK